MNDSSWLKASPAVLIALVSLGPQAQETPAAGNAIAGQALYYQHACYSCHGYTGETGVRALLGSGFLLSPAVFTNFLRQRADQNPVLPSTQMPNYPESSLSDSEALDLYAYIRTFVSHAPPLEDIPALNAIVDAASLPSAP
jgi:mono/diheme cytochrome c family protein